MKGPKGILASSIATALDEFFEVDKDQIESTLLGDAQIALKEMKLRPRLTQLPNSWANIEGSVDKATFSWIWGPAGNWVKDATLTIQGLKVVATITEDNPQQVQEEEPTQPQKKRPSLVENMEQAAQSHTVNPEEITNQGGIQGYIQNQVQKIIDSMKLRVEKYQLSIVLPKQQQVATTEEEEGIEVEETGAVQIDTTGEILELISLGRIIPTNPDVSSCSLEQELILQDFIMQIKEIAPGSSSQVVLDLVERFTYKASTHRSSGQRFNRIMENLQLQGHGGDLKVHLGTRQLQTLSYLGVLLMAPPSEAKEGAKENKEEEEDKEDSNNDIAPGNTPSHFDFDLGLLQLTMDTNRMELPNARFVYRADGTIMKLESDGFSMQGGSGAGSGAYSVKVSKGMQANLLSPVTLTIGSIDEILMPYMAKLTNPVANTKIVKEGQSYAVEFVDDVQIEMLKGKEQAEGTDDTISTEVSVSKEETKTDQEVEPQYKANVVPFPLSVSTKHLVLTKEEDDNRTDFHNFYAFANPTDQGTEFALDLGKVQNYLLCVEDALVAGKLDQENQINKFRFSAQQVQVTAGHTPGEWAAAFEPQGTAEEKEARFQKAAEDRKKKSNQERQSQQQKQQQPSPPMKFPNCYIDPLRLTISWKAPGMTMAAVKDTKVTIQQYQGKDDTTAQDLVQYYVQSCLSHASDFIPNAELLGLNVVDSTMGTVGNYIGMATLGPLGGIAAIGAVDAVKQTISAGKKSRNQDDGARTDVMDVFRGIAYNIQETGHNFETNPIHFAQDTIENTGAYIDENKARLGGAGVGGAGMILGGIFGGPAGAIVAGVLSQAVAERVITTIDDTGKKEPLKLEA